MSVFYKEIELGRSRQNFGRRNQANFADDVDEFSDFGQESYGEINVTSDWQ